ncbi:MAG: hypothetical protein ABJE66_05210 [Deltaproteobacteria bacterium]
MINVAGVWVMLAAVLLGWGLAAIWLLRRLGGGSFRGMLSGFQTIWLGYAALLAFIQLASVAAPVNRGVLALSLLPAVAGFIACRRAVADKVRGLLQEPRRIAVVCVLVIGAAIVVDYAACDHVELYDTGLYHLQAVKWTARYGVVTGLANLHTRFGYNNSIHVFAAYVDAYWEGVAVHLTSGLIVLIALAQWFTEIFLARSPRQRVRQLFCLLTLPVLLTRLWTQEPASLSSDFPEAVFAAVLVLEVLTLYAPSREHSLLAISAVLSIGAVAFTTKLVGLSAFCVIGAVALWRMRSGVTWRARCSVALVPCALVLGWLVRGVIESGWLLYPVAGRLPVSWAVPAKLAADDLGNIQSWSRIWGQPPSEVFGHGVWHWLGPWLSRFRESHEFMLLVVALALLAWRVAFGPTRSGARRFGEWAAIAVCGLGIAQWFAGAPDLRYGGFWFWLLPAALLAPLLAPAMRDALLRRFVVVIALAVCVWSGAFEFRVNAVVPKLWGRPVAPRHVWTTLVTLPNGLEVNAPDNGDQCFAEALPCTPMGGNAKARVPGDLGAGFLPSSAD